MVFFKYATMQMAAKIVYYGPGLCGKTTNLHYIYQKTSWFDRAHFCSSGANCKGDYLGRGPITIPGLAWLAFALVLLAIVAVWRRGGPLPLGRAQLTELEARVPLVVDLEALHPGPPDREPCVNCL